MDTWKEVKCNSVCAQSYENQERWELFKKSNEFERLQELKESLLRNIKDIVKDTQ